ncbi:hypothetical protein [Phenylobacterium zucineum]|uniref:hypothetical protein n=1 Tax=Phenylobacterium zucineum TaxID=284016 RepID=UPI00031815E6|nr:hypothetical protein [Phenylobacterium zucineum]
MVSAAPSGIRVHGPGPIRIHRTYELYLHGDDGPPRFEALTCGSEAELMTAVRRILTDRGVQSVDVREFGELLFTLTA